MKGIITKEIANDLVDTSNKVIDQHVEHLPSFMKSRAIQEVNRLAVEFDIDLDLARALHVIGTNTVARMLIDCVHMRDDVAEKAMLVHLRMAIVCADSLARFAGVSNARLRTIVKESIRYGAEMYVRGEG